MASHFLLRTLLIAAAMLSSLGARASEAAPDGVLKRITSAAAANLTSLAFDGTDFSGPGFDKLVEEGRLADFFLIGEEHGIAENPKLAASLFRALKPQGYQRLVIEVSPAMARSLDRAVATGGMAGLTKLFAQPGGEPVFFGLKEEADLLVAVRGDLPADAEVLWGVDYELLGDRHLIAMLEAADKPPGAVAALAVLKEASRAAWAQHRQSGNPQFIFSFSGNPDLVRRLRESWPRRGVKVEEILATLEQTLEINALYMAGRNRDSNARRAAFIRANFLRHWKALEPAGPRPGVMVKMGASHLVRGRNHSEVFDLGALLPELAETIEAKLFSLMILPGRDAKVAVFDPVTLRYRPSAPKDDYARHLAPLLAAAPAEGFTLIDLRPLRSISGLSRSRIAPDLMKTIMGYDMLLLLTGSTASKPLEGS